MTDPRGGHRQPGEERRAVPRRRLAPEARRAEILRAALATFTELGFERATLQDVADRAGVTKGALYHYFDSKDQLFRELIRGHLGELLAAGDARLAAADKSLSPAEMLQLHLDSMWASLQEPHVLELSELIMAELPKFPDLGREFFEEVVRPSRQTTRRVLERAGAGAATDEDLEALAAALPAMLLGAARTYRILADIDPLRLSPERLGAAVTRALVAGCAR